MMGGRRRNRNNFPASFFTTNPKLQYSNTPTFHIPMHNQIHPSIQGTTRGLCRLQTPPNVPRGEVWRYGYGFPFQVSPTQAAIMANIHRKQAPTEDFEIGADVIVFDELRRLIPERAVKISRMHREWNPKANEDSDMIKQCPVGGFIPLGAKRADGSPHPHAGTGFGMGIALSYAIDDGDRSKPYRGCFRGAQSHLYNELQQYAFDGTTFKITRTDHLGIDEVLSGELFLNCPMTMAIPDGDDLLATAAMGRPGATIENVMGEESSITCIIRWRRGENGWRPVSCHPVATEFVSMEPSLIRDVDGSLLCSMRPGYTAPNRRDLLVFRSSDGGKTWQRIIDVKNIRYQSPITLNQAADGTPYIVCNHYVSALMNYQGNYMDGFMRTTSREMLCLWALNAERDGLLSPHILSFPRYQYGRPPTVDRVEQGPNATDIGQTNLGRDWTCDHPTATTVRLADGHWHNVLCHRLLAQAEVQGALPPTPYSGLCVEEVLSSGPERAVWKV